MYQIIIALLFFVLSFAQGTDTICQNQCVAYFSLSTQTPGLVGDLVLFDAKTQAEILVPDTADEPSSLAWSSSGRSLIFGNTLSLLDLASMEIQAIAPVTAQEDTIIERGSYGWLPGDNRIIFVRGIRHLDEPSYRTTLLLQNSDGTNLQQLTPDLLNVSLPTISPNGTKVAFVGMIREHDTEQAHRDIYLLTLKTGEITRLTDHRSHHSMPDWSSDGQHLAYISKNLLFMMQADGGESTPLTDTIASNPQWGMEDTQIVYIAFEDNRSLLNMVEVATGEITTLRSHDVVGTFSLSPDGTQIAYLSRDTGQADQICGFSLIEDGLEWCAQARPHGATDIAWR